jgi:hypothetical protein
LERLAREDPDRADPLFCAALQTAEHLVTLALGMQGALREN